MAVACVGLLLAGEPQTGKSTLLGHMLKSSSGSGVRSSLCECWTGKGRD